MSNVLSGLVFAGFVMCTAITGALFPTGPWYEALNKPWWTPPNWVFPIAWTILYTMIGYAGWRVWKADGITAAVIVWGIGLVLNAAWSWLMFDQHQIGWSMIDLAGMWVSIAAFIWLAMPIDKNAAYLMVPYLIWTTYAGALNLWIWLNN
jgi:translocator protein